MHGGKRSRNMLATAPVLYRARMTATDPWGDTQTWFEGPYSTLSKATGRITFWQGNYRVNPERKGWQVVGQPEEAVMDWTPRPG